MYFPELSEVIKAYFGPEIFYPANIFITLSFISLFVFFLLFFRYTTCFPAYSAVRSVPRLNIIFYAVILIHFFFISYYFASNYDLINYANASDEQFLKYHGTSLIVFGIGFKHSVFINLLLYFMLRVNKYDSPHVNKAFVLPLLILELSLFLMIAFKLGNRADILSLTLGIVFVEIELMRSAKVKYLNFACITVAIILVLFILVKVEGLRGSEFVDDYAFIERIIYKDYYAPAHILFAAIGFNYINPWEVLASNFYNSLILVGHPYLQETVTELFNPGITTRSASYAFYIFSEGYLVFGLMGFLYNGLIFFVGISIWRLFSNSSNNYFNLFLLSLMASQAANIARGQSSYFIKDIYTIFIPAIVLLYLGTGLIPLFRRSFNKEKSLNAY